MNKKTVYKIITLLIPVMILFLYLIKDLFITFAVNLPVCLFYRIYHLYCPSCGNTRSVIALLHGDILSSLRFNIVIPILTVLLTLGYIELAAFSFGKQIRILPRKLSFYMCLIALLILYWIIRNFFPYLTPVK